MLEMTIEMRREREHLARGHGNFVATVSFLSRPSDSHCMKRAIEAVVGKRFIIGF